MKRPPPARTIACGVALLAGLAATSDSTSVAAETSPPQAAQVVVVKAANGCFSSVIRVTGFLVAREEAVVALDLPGLRVIEVLAGEGDKVTAGQPLVRLAHQTGEGPDTAAGRSINTLRAPVTGVVTQSNAVVGATASAMAVEPLFRIAVDNEIELEADVPSVHVPKLASGQSARVEVEGSSRDFSGRVRLVPAAVDRRTQVGRTRLSLERDPSLRLGTFVRAVIDASRSCGISVPGSSVLYRTEGASVQVVRENVIETRLVQIGLHSGADTEVRDGLREGDLVVANAGSSLRDGDKVSPIVADGGRIAR